MEKEKNVNKKDSNKSNNKKALGINNQDKMTKELTQENRKNQGSSPNQVCIVENSEKKNGRSSQNSDKKVKTSVTKDSNTTATVFNVKNLRANREPIDVEQKLEERSERLNEQIIVEPVKVNSGSGEDSIDKAEGATELADGKCKESDNQSNAQSGDNTSEKQKSSKKTERPSSVSLQDKSELFKLLIDCALSVEKLEKKLASERLKVKKLTDKQTELTNNISDLKAELKVEIVKEEQLRTLINKLENDIKQREYANDVLRGDMKESDVEFKNSLGAALGSAKKDFLELNDLSGSIDASELSEAYADTIKNIFEVLESKGISIN